MTAPALLVLAQGSCDFRSSRCVRDLVASTRRLRPDLRVDAAFLDHSSPEVGAAVAQLVDRGHREIVVVPLLLSPADARVEVPEAVKTAAERHPDVSICAADLIGPDPSLLTVLDERLRDALRSARVCELDALILASAGSSDTRANTIITRLARVWGNRHHLPISVAFASTSPPSTGEAVREFRRQGRRHVAVGSMFIAPGRLPDRAGELALEAGAVAVSAPLGAHATVVRLVLARYSVGALQLVELPA